MVGNIGSILADLTAIGVEVRAHGDRLRFRPYAAVPPDLLDRMRAHKDELLANVVITQIRESGDSDFAEALAEAWEERIAICVEDGRVSQQVAEAVALTQLRTMIANRSASLRVDNRAIVEARVSPSE